MAEHKVDAIVYPLQELLVVPIGELTHADRNGILAAMAECPALTIPIDFSRPAPDAPLGVPIGCDSMGRPSGDACFDQDCVCVRVREKMRREPQSTRALK